MMQTKTRADRWTRIYRALSCLEEAVEAAAADDRHPDHQECAAASEWVNQATSMASFAIEEDEGVDPPPRGQCRIDWWEANRRLPRTPKDPDLLAAVRAVWKLLS